MKFGALAPLSAAFSESRRTILVLTARFLLIAAPLGYLALTGYLLAQIMPLPIAIMPLASREDERVRTPLAA